MARPMPISSSLVAVVPGTSSPSIDLCRIVREVEKPSAPARRPSSTICDMRAMSVRGRRLVARAALAHDVGAHGAVRHVGRDVDGARQLLERVEILGKALPVPGQPSASAVPGMSSTPSIRPISHWCAIGRGRREADAAVAHDDGGDAVPGRRRHLRVPRRLAVIVRVDVDEARRDDLAGRVDLLACRAAAPGRPR